MKIRPGTMDEYIVKEIQRSYGWMCFDGAVVLDLGGCFGAFALMALEKGASRVLSVEPEADNLALMKENRQEHKALRSRWEILEGAAVSDTHLEPNVQLYVSDGTNKGSHTLKPTRGREPVTVAAHRIGNIFEMIQPEIMKVDIEGAEYDIFKSGLSLPATLDEITVEMHFKVKSHREAAVKLHEYFQEQGFAVEQEPKLEGSNWYTLAKYIR